MNAKNLLAPFFLLLIAAAALPAQEQKYPRGLQITIQGEVRYAQGGRAAENVLVRLEYLSGGMAGQVRTDRTGKFSFAGITQSLYRVTVSTVGYQPATQDVDLTTSPNAHIILTLAPDKPVQENRVSQNTDSMIDSKVPIEARDEYEKGRATLLDGSDPANGIQHLENAVKIYPGFLQAQLLLGTAYLDLHQMDKAESALKRVLEMNPKAGPALLALGEVYLETKRFPEAEKALQQGLQWDNASWQGHLAMGRLYLDTGDAAKAGPEIGRALQLKPDNAETYLYAGNLLLKANKAEDALQMFSQYLHLAPKGQYAAETQKVVEKIKKAIAEKKK
ncbi:MAG: tetratricopeptide repeat protein [Acidobacteriia bacterium]|nr:tetratricopeptide repeat protein [Terriglobia bacterium]